MRRVVTQSGTKRVTAAALAEAKARNGWSNVDAGDALGCGEGTIRNRLDGDDVHHQMTVHELRRSIQADGPTIANAILDDVGFELMPVGCHNAVDALQVAGAQARCAAELIAAVPDGIDRAEAVVLLPLVTGQRNHLAALERTLRAIINPEPGEPARA